MSSFEGRAAAKSARVRAHFQQKASSFDRLYDARHTRYLRPAIFRRLRLAIEEVSLRDGPTVLDIGCGSGRVGELALEAGASAYVGVDFSAAMVELARRRLGQFGGRVRLLQDDVLEAEIGDRFDVILALGVFDYTPEPERVAARMYDLCAGTAIASFPRWNWFKGPIRKLRYELLSDCPIFDYDAAGVSAMFDDVGFSRLRFLEQGWSDFVVAADRRVAHGGADLSADARGL